MVLRALATMLALGTLMVLGVPVEPLVRTERKGAALFHCCMNSVRDSDLDDWLSGMADRECVGLILKLKEHMFAAEHEGHGNVLCKELTSAKTLREVGVGTIEFGGQMGNGIESYVALEGTGEPRAYAHIVGKADPLTCARYATMEGGFKNNILWLYGTEHQSFLVGRGNTYELFVEGNGNGRTLAYVGHLVPLLGTDGLLDGVDVEMAEGIEFAEGIVRVESAIGVEANLDVRIVATQGADHE